MPTKDKVQSQKVLELNPDHPVFQSLVGAYNSEDTQKPPVYTALLYDQAMLIGGLNIEDPVTLYQPRLRTDEIKARRYPLGYRGTRKSLSDYLNP